MTVRDKLDSDTKHVFIREIPKKALDTSYFMQVNKL